MKISIICFTNKGAKIAEKIANNLENADFVHGFGQEKVDFKVWTKNRFSDSDAIIFVSAMGICVRAIAPNILDKTKDPAVIVIDDNALHCISVLSGHLGGANELTLRISKLLNSNPVITTATDVNQVFAIDDFARKQGFLLENTNNIKNVSSKLLKNHQIFLKTDLKVKNLPKNVIKSDVGCDVYMSYKNIVNENALIIKPKVLNVGIGCRRNSENIEKTLIEVLKNHNLDINCIKKIASIDVKKDEIGILELCKKMNIKPIFYSAEELNQVTGNFTKSDFVKTTVGTDNVCERSAKKLGGEIIVHKTAINGVTVAIALENNAIDFKY